MYSEIYFKIKSNKENTIMEENERTVLEQLQANLEAMQKQIDHLKAEENKPEKSSMDVARETLAAAISDEARKNKKLISTSLTTVTNKYGGLVGTSSTCIEDNIDDIDEDVLAVKLEPFTNPKRIAILKALQNEDLTATDISMKTRCVGGQLYHHLNNLVNAGLIYKESDKFKIGHQTILIALNTVICLINNAPNEKEPSAIQ